LKGIGDELDWKNVIMGAFSGIIFYIFIFTSYRKRLKNTIKYELLLENKQKKRMLK